MLLLNHFSELAKQNTYDRLFAASQDVETQDVETQDADTNNNKKGLLNKLN